MSRIDVCANANIIFLLSDAQRTLKGKDLQGKGVKKCCLVLLYSLIFGILGSHRRTHQIHTVNLL